LVEQRAHESLTDAKETLALTEAASAPTIGRDREALIIAVARRANDVCA
jgi:hypothetical protein